MKLRNFMIGITIACVPLVVHGQTFPVKPVRLIVTYPAGGSADTLARFLGQHLSETWSQQLVVDNRPGANGIVGTELAAKSPPDGYTLYLATDGPISINPSLYANLPYDWKRDFAPVTLLAILNQVLVVPASLPAQSVQELIALAKQRPGQLNYASIGIGSSPHLGAELFKSLAGVDMTHVPYKGAGQTVSALLSGEAAMLFTSEQTAAPHVKSGKLRALATTAKKRSIVFPDVPTVAESGLPEFEMRIWFGLFAPAGTPEALIRKLHADFASSLQTMRDALIARGYDPQSSTPEEFRALVQNDQDRWAALVRKAGIKAQ
jgi:tripartite-type tricarboxylate transporter receptor subunit TctC